MAESVVVISRVKSNLFKNAREYCLPLNDTERDDGLFNVCYRSLEIEVKNFNLKMADGRKEPFDKACAVDERFFEQFNKSTR